MIIRIRTWLLRDGAAIFLLAVAAAISIYPVLPALRWHVIGWPGDNVQYVYMSGWVAEALRTGQSPLLDPHLNAPGYLWLPATDAPFLSMVLVAPLAWLFTPTLAYNAILFLSSFCSGYFTYLWLRRITNHRAAGLLAGLAFLLAPYRIVHSYGHLQLISTQCIPLFFWALDAVLHAADRGATLDETRRSAWQRWLPELTLAGATALVGAMSQYYLVICGMTGAVYAMLAGLPLRVYVRRAWRWVLAIGVGALLSAWPYLLTARDMAYTGYTLEETRIWSANPLDFVMPSRLHPLWGGWFEQVYPRLTWIEHTLYLGVIVGGLAVLALLVRPPAQRRLMLRWGGVALVAFVLALGTDLHVGLNSHPLNATQPWHLPMYYLAQLPGVTLMRTWSRFGVITIFFVSALAGLGLAWLHSRWVERASSKWRNVLVVGCVVLLCIDVVPGRLVHFTLRPRPIDLWLAQQRESATVSGDEVVVVLPAGASNYEDMFGSLWHRLPMPAYNHPTHLPTEFRQFAEAMRHFPDAVSLTALRTMRTRYIVLNRALYDGVQAPKWSDIAAQLSQLQQLRKIHEIGDFQIYVWTT